MDSIAKLALLRVREHHYSEGESVLREQLAKRTQLFTAHNTRTAAGEYSLACALAVQGKRDEAFSQLESLMDDGPEPDTFQGMSSDPDLMSLHTDPRFNNLTAKGKKYIAALQNNK